MVAHRIASLLLLLTLAANAVAQTFPPKDTVSEYRHQGTYYHNRFEGRKTSSGEIFNQNLFTAAHHSIKLGTHLMVTNCNTGKQVIVKVNDRCPRRGVLDLSHRAAASIGIKGSQPVTLRILPDGYEERCLAQDKIFDSVYSRLAGEQVSDEESPKEKPVAAKPKAKPRQRSGETGRYDLLIGIASTHGEAFEIIQNAPEKYRDMILVDPLEDDSGFNIIIDLNLKKADIVKLQKRLKNNLPGCIIVASDD